MPPKKAAAGAEKKAVLGRPSNNLKIGIVGLPNVGKSSFFNVLSDTDLGKAANFPYATINPEEARIPVPDARFEWLCDVYKPASKVPAFLTCIDIAGLTAGASTGAGLGNSFLSHVRAVDGIFQMVRSFDDAEVIHVEGEVNPIRDMEIIREELRLKDEEWVEKHLDTLKKSGRALGSNSLADKAKKEEIATIEKILKVVKEDKRDVRKAEWTNKEVDVVNGLQLLTAKPVIYLVNLSEKDYVRKKNKWLPKIKAWIDENNPGDLLIPFSVALEERLAPLSAEEKAEEAKTGAASALGKITTAGYAGLDLIRYFTCGPDEVRAWTIRKGTKAPQAAGVIHSDFENKFVCGEIMSYDDLKEYGSEAAVKAVSTNKRVNFAQAELKRANFHRLENSANKANPTRTVRKAQGDENSVSAKAGTSVVGKSSAQTGSAARAALGDVSNARKILQGKGEKGKLSEKTSNALHRRTASAVAGGRQPLGPRNSISTRPPTRPIAGRSISAVLSSASTNSISVAPAQARVRASMSASVVTCVKSDSMEVEEVVNAGGDTDPEDNVQTMEDVIEIHEEQEQQVVPEKQAPAAQPQTIEEDVEIDEDDWTFASPTTNARYQAAIQQVKETFKDEVDETDMTMVSEYADEIFAYMSKLELQCMANPTYMEGQTEIEWSMRRTLIDWLLQVHLRYHMLPETLWIAVNIVDRFLSRRVVSLIKLQLVGVTAMFIASKYEEIMAPSVEEFAFMTENGYSRDEILKGEKIILQTLDFNISPYCSPYSWVRRISKADDYDIQTRTLCKFLMEVTLLDHRFLRAKPSLTAAVGMYTSKRMLQGSWDEAFVYYSDFTEEQLIPGFYLLVEDLAEKGFESSFLCKKYANKKFLKASLFARDWALQFLHHHGGLQQ
ncbi:hypothetical protein FRB90_011759 [Tulasnella sp. 427]|nr:hypothetical protein FRB90_011759 [Tulasnella sp. 427]